MDKKKLKGYLEFFASISNSSLNVELDKLVEAMDRTQIHTFGWPIGIVIHNEEDRPKPFEKGIRCFIDSGRHYNYWSLARNGEFYLLNNLFEDIGEHGDRTGGIFFDTRTIRTTEVFLRTGMLYKYLEVPGNEIIECKLEYGGLRDRVLTAANPNRAITMSPPVRKCSVDKVEKIFEAPLSDFLEHEKIKGMVFEVIKSITEMCDFFVPSKSLIIDPMVEAYLNGDII